MLRIRSAILYLVAMASIGACFVAPQLVGGNQEAVIAIVVALLIFATLLDNFLLISALVRLAHWHQWGWFALLGVGVLIPPVYLVILLVGLPIYLLAGPQKSAGSRKSGVLSVAHKPQMVSNVSGRSWEVEPHILVGQFPRAASHYATWVERAAAATIDLTIIEAIGLAVGLAASMGYSLVSTQPEPPNTINIAVPLPILLGMAAIWLLFNGTIFVLWPMQWTQTGQTFGQRAVSIRVVTTDGGNVRFGAALLRAICIFWTPVGWLWLLVDPRRQTWHDKLAGTVVIKDGDGDSR